MRIFTFPANYEQGAVVYEANASFARGDPAPQLSDGRTDTFNTTENYVIDFAGTGNITTNALFTETSGFDNVSLTVGGSTVTDSPINTAAQLRGTRHYAATLHFGGSASEARLSFGGGPGRVYRCALVRQLLNIDPIPWTRISHRHQGEGNRRRTNVNGNSIIISSRAGRWKTISDFIGFFPSTASPSIEQILDTLEANDNFFIWPEPTVNPTFFYPASIQAGVQVDYVGGLTSQRELNFTIHEL